MFRINIGLKRPFMNFNFSIIRRHTINIEVSKKKSYSDGKTQNETDTQFKPNLNKYIEIEVKSEENANMRTDRLIKNKYDLSWDSVQKHFRNNDIFLVRNNSNKIKNPNEKTQINDKVYISKRIIERNAENASSNEGKSSNFKLNLDEESENYLEHIFRKMVVLESKEMLVINKLSNLACQDGSGLKFSVDTMLQLMNKKDKDKYNLKLVHRLDKNVSGLMLIGNQIETVRKLGDNLKENQIEKKYISLVQGIPLYLKYLLKEGKVNSVSGKFFKDSLSGFIKSNETCDQFVIELDNGYDFINNSKENDFSLLKHGVSNSNNIEEMYGQFRVTGFIFYDVNKHFKFFNLNSIEMWNLRTLESLHSYLLQIKDAFPNTGNLECYSVIDYELGSGRQHQIRKHMSKCFFTPIFNDTDYLFDAKSSKAGWECFKSMKMERNNPKNGSPINEFYTKYKLDEPQNLIFLQSYQISLDSRKFDLADVRVNQNKIMYKLDNEGQRISIKSHSLGKIFYNLFEKMNLNTNEIYKI